MRVITLTMLLIVSSCGGASLHVSEPSTTMPAAAPTTVAPSTVVTTTSVPSTDPLPATTTTPAEVIDVSIRVESEVEDIPLDDFETVVMMTLLDERGWAVAGFRFYSEESAVFRVVLAEPSEVDRLCAPLRTNGRVSCQNGPVVAINADRWRSGVPHWTLGLDTYRQYLVNHEVGHLIGMRHPEPRCPQAGQPAAVMSQQTYGLEGCSANVWPRPWELALARARPATLAPDPDWSPGPPPRNEGT